MKALFHVAKHVAGTWFGLRRTPVTARETLSLREVGRVLYSLYCSRFRRGSSGDAVNLRTA